MKPTVKPIERLADGTFKINGPIAFTCGCGGVGTQVKTLLRNAGVDWVNVVSTPTNNNARWFIRSSGLSEAEPSLKKSKFAVLYHPTTGKYINLLGVEKSNSILANIYSVSSGL